jgi:hypothetical protein
MLWRAWASITRASNYKFGSMLILEIIRFEWDPVKARTNQRKHGVSFMDAMTVFEDPFALFEQDRIGETGELRWQAALLDRWLCCWWPSPFGKKERAKSVT